MCEPLLDTRQLAELLNVKRAWIHDQVQMRRLPHLRLGRQLRYRLSDIQTWLVTQEHPELATLPGPRSRTSA